MGKALFFHSVVEETIKLIAIEREDDGNLTKVSLFLIHRAIHGLAGDLKSVKKLKNGNILIEASSNKNAEMLLQIKKLGDDIPARAKPHERLNHSIGIIYDADLDEILAEEIFTELKSQNVVDVRRIISKRNGQEIKTNL